MKRPNPRRAPLDRRGFLEGVAAGAGGLALTGCGGGGDDGNRNLLAAAFAPPLPSSTVPARYAAAAALPALPAGATSGVDHIVLVTMENRSYDHFLGWVTGGEGPPAGLKYSDAFGSVHPVFPLATEPGYGYGSCGWADPNHSYEAGRDNLNDGKMNGWLLTADTNKTQGDRLPVGYFRREDLAFYAAASTEYTVCDAYFSGTLSETYPNRLYLHSGQTDRLDNSLVTSSLPTVWDRLAEKSVSAAYYYHDAPFTALYGTRHVGLSKKVDEFYAAAAAGTLPAFSMVDPRFGSAANGTSNDDHPHSDVRNGQAFVSQVYEALRAGPKWGNTLLVVVYDEWGGFFDHMVPPKRIVSADEAKLGNDGRLGFRVPCLLMGPRVKRGTVSRHPYDPASIHALLAWRFGLAPLGVRGSDPSTVNLAHALDLTAPPRADRVVLPKVAPIATDCPGVLPSRAGDDRRAAQSSPSETGAAAELPGGRFHDVWLKARANGFPV